MNKKLMRLALKGFLEGNGIPRSREAKRKLAAEFVEYLGTMNQSDRDFNPAEKYSTSSHEEHEKTQPGHPWKDDKRDDVGFGIPRTAARKKKAIEATKLSFLVLGPEQSDDLLEAQAREFMAMSNDSIKSTHKRIRTILANDETGQEENPEHNEVDSDEDAVSELEDATESGGTDGGAEEVDKLEDACNKTSETEEEPEADEADEETKEADEVEETKEADEVEEDEETVDAELESIFEASEAEDAEEDSDDEEPKEASETEESDEEEAEEEEKMEVAMDNHELADTTDSDIAAEDEVLSMLYEDEPKNAEQKRTASSKKGVKKLGRVTSESKGSDDVDSLSKLWEGSPRIDWKQVDDGLFDG